MSYQAAVHACMHACMPDSNSLYAGGKDSTVLAHLLTLLNKRHSYGLQLFLLSIDEGITGMQCTLQHAAQNEPWLYCNLQSSSFLSTQTISTSMLLFSETCGKESVHAAIASFKPYVLSGYSCGFCSPHFGVGQAEAT